MIVESGVFSLSIITYKCRRGKKSTIKDEARAVASSGHSSRIGPRKMNPAVIHSLRLPSIRTRTHTSGASSSCVPKESAIRLELEVKGSGSCGWKKVAVTGFLDLLYPLIHARVSRIFQRCRSGCADRIKTTCCIQVGE